MHVRQLSAIAVICLGFPLVACGNGGEAPSATEQDAAAVPAAGGVIREEVRPAEAPAPVAPTVTVIQSQPGPDGAQVDLLKVAVTGDILTVTLRCASSEKVNYHSFKLSQISVIDDATAQRISVLKDNNGEWLASNVTGDHISTNCEVQPGVFWAKFPAPPATSQTVSINIPEVAPFDGVPVTR